MFIKVTELDTSQDVYLNPDHIIKIVANGAGQGALVFLTQLVPSSDAPHILAVHESAEEIYRTMGRMTR